MTANETIEDRAIAASELTLEQRLKAAVWMVGNMDTLEDKAAWWRTFEAVWQEVARDPNVQSCADAMADAADRRPRKPRTVWD